MQTLTPSLNMTGKTISTYIVYEVARRLAEVAVGEVVELIIDANEALDNDLHAWCRTSGHELVGVSSAESQRRYVIRKSLPQPTGRRLAAVISNPGLEELLSPLSFALAAALEGLEVSLYFQGPAVRVLSRGFVAKLTGPGRPFSRFARAGLAAIGHVPAQQKIGQLQSLGAHVYVCGPSMQHFGVSREDLAFDDLTIAEYLTFMEVMAAADIHLYV